MAGTAGRGRRARGGAGQGLSSAPSPVALQVAIKRVARESVLQWYELVSERGHRDRAGRGGQG